MVKIQKLVEAHISELENLPRYEAIIDELIEREIKKHPFDTSIVINFQPTQVTEALFEKLKPLYEKEGWQIYPSIRGFIFTADILKYKKAYLKQLTAKLKEDTPTTPPDRAVKC